MDEGAPRFLETQIFLQIERERPLPMNLKIWSFGILSSYNCIVKLFLSRQSIENLATAVRPFKAVPIGCPRTVYVFFPTLATGRNG